MNEKEAAEALGKILQEHPQQLDLLPGTKVAIFVFRPEVGRVNVGFISAVPVDTLRRWVQGWLDATASETPPEQGAVH